MKKIFILLPLLSLVGCDNSNYYRSIGTQEKIVKIVDIDTRRTNNSRVLEIDVIDEREREYHLRKGKCYLSKRNVKVGEYYKIPFTVRRNSEGDEKYIPRVDTCQLARYTTRYRVNL